MRTENPLRDRRAAGRALGERLSELSDEAPVVVALPRAGVPVGYEVARALGAPLDIILVRKLGVPGHPDLGLGTLCEEGRFIVDSDVVRDLGISRAELQAAIAREQIELDRSRARYRREHPMVPIEGRTVVLVDDRLDSGVTAVSAARLLRARGARRVVAAIPVCSDEAARALAPEFDEFASLGTLQELPDTGWWSRDAAAVSEAEVVALLRASRRSIGTASRRTLLTARP